MISATPVPCEAPGAAPHEILPRQVLAESKRVTPPRITLLAISGFFGTKLVSITATVTPVPSIPALC